MFVIEAPDQFPPHADLFLAGGISNCPDWQREAIELVDHLPGALLNPRRQGEFTEDIASEQIEWEYNALKTVQAVVFWFPKETLCPITLFELGVFTQRKDVKVFVGTHPDYARRFDVIKQLSLARPEIQVQSNVSDLMNEYENTMYST